MTDQTAPSRRSWPIDREGTCDGCSESKRLVMAYDVDDHNEPHLCADCVADQRSYAAIERVALEGRNLLPDATDDQAAVIEAWALAVLDA